VGFVRTGQCTCCQSLPSHLDSPLPAASWPIPAVRPAEVASAYEVFQHERYSARPTSVVNPTKSIRAPAGPSRQKKKRKKHQPSRPAHVCFATIKSPFAALFTDDVPVPPTAKPLTRPEVGPRRFSRSPGVHWSSSRFTVRLLHYGLPLSSRTRWPFDESRRASRHG